MTKEVYRPGSTVEADLLRALLREKGVESTVENDNSSQWNYRSVTAPLTVRVAEGDEPRALEILKDHFQSLKEGEAAPTGGYARSVSAQRTSRARVLIAFYAVVIGLLVLAVIFSIGRTFLRH